MYVSSLALQELAEYELDKRKQHCFWRTHGCQNKVKEQGKKVFVSWKVHDEGTTTCGGYITVLTTVNRIAVVGSTVSAVWCSSTIIICLIYFRDKVLCGHGTVKEKRGNAKTARTRPDLMTATRIEKKGKETFQKICSLVSYTLMATTAGKDNNAKNSKKPWVSKAAQLEQRFASLRKQDLIEERFGYEKVQGGESRLGWLLNMHAVRSNAAPASINLTPRRLSYPIGNGKADVQASNTIFFRKAERPST